MDDTTILGSTLGQLGQTVKQAAKQVVKVPEEMARDTAGQVGGMKRNEAQASSAKGSGEPQWQSDEERVKFLRDLYGPGKKEDVNSVSKKPTEFEEQVLDKSPEEQKKLVELRGQLHQQNYYEPTFNPVKKQEERPAEKVENEKQKEMMELQKKEQEKPPALAAQRAAQRVENLPGAG